MFLLTALLAFAVQSDSPEAAFEAVKKAATAKDWVALFDSIAPTDRKEVEGQIAKQAERLGKPEAAQELKMTAQMLGIPEKELLALKPRDFFLKMMAKMSEQDAVGFEKEFGKYKSGTIVSKAVDGDLCTFKVKHEEKEEEVEFVREDGKWYFGAVSKDRRAAGQRMASARLKALSTAQADFRANDRDGDKENNFWVKDIAGLYGVEAGGEAIKLIEIETAQADRTPGKGAYPSIKGEGESPSYYFATVKNRVEGGQKVPYDAGKGRNPNKFGMMAYPSSYGKSGKLTYIISEQNVVYSKDTGGKPVEDFPEHPAKEGWKKVD